MNKPSSDKEGETIRTSKIYANLRALGIDVEAVKRCNPTLEQLNEFHDSVLKVLDESGHSFQSIAA